MTPTLNDVQSIARDYTAGRKTQYGVQVPKIASPVTLFGAAVSGGAGNQVVLIDYIVKPNYFALFEGIVLGYSGGPLNPGDAIFTVDINRPLGVTNTGYTERDYGSVPFPIGSLIGGPIWPCHFRHRNKEEIRVKVKDISGNNSQFTAALVGWEWPETSQGA